jgi:hypothetical protein
MEWALPDEVAEQVARLGQPLEEFRAGTFGFVLSLALGVLALLLALVVLGAMIALLFILPRGKGGVGVAFFKMLGMALFLLAAGVGVLRRASGMRGLRVLVGPAGLARLQGATVEVLRWEDVNAVKRAVNAKAEGITVSNPVQLTLVGRAGQAFEFNESLAGLRELRQLAEQHTLPHMLPPAAEALDGGATVGFGALSVSREGLHHQTDTLPWGQFQDAEVVKGLVVVRPLDARRPFCRVAVDQVPNVHVMLALAEHARYRYA